MADQFSDTLGRISRESECRTQDPGYFSDHRTSTWDPGSITFGVYQFTWNSTRGIDTPTGFVKWVAKQNGSDVSWLKNGLSGQYQRLLNNTPDTEAFQTAWREIGVLNRTEFTQLQTDFAMVEYYDPTIAVLPSCGIQIRDDLAWHQMVWAIAVNLGPGVTTANTLRNACENAGVDVNTCSFDQLVNAVTSYRISNDPGLKDNLENEKTRLLGSLVGSGLSYFKN